MEELETAVLSETAEQTAEDTVLQEVLETAADTEEKKAGKPVGKIVKRVAIGVGIAVLSLVLLVVGTFLFIFYSPWTHELRDQYILMTYKTSNPWLCTLFFSQDTIDEVYKNNGSVQPDDDVNTDLVRPNPGPTDPTGPNNPENPTTPPEPVPEPTFKTSEKYPAEVIYDDGQVQILQFSGKTGKGKYTARLIQIKDPSRVELGMTNQLGDKDDPEGTPGWGQTITSMCNTNNALCGINAGGFIDIGGVGTGGIPIGTVVKDGVMTVYTEESDHKLIGFNRDNILVIGQFTEEEVKEQGIRDAVSWRAPTHLVLNGELVEYYGLAGGYDPRSAIGQCADGTVLLLVVDGSSLRGIDGANFALMADIMYAFQAVNAANLDGGTSSSMALNGKLINTVCNPQIAKRGRFLATGWLVKRATEE